MTTREWIILGACGVAALAAVLYLGPLVPPWLRARRRGVSISFSEAVSMRLRRTDVRRVLDAACRVSPPAPPVAVETLEVAFMAGADVDALVDAWVEFHRRRIACTWQDAFSLEIAGQDVLAIARAGIPPQDVFNTRALADRFRRKRPSDHQLRT